MVGLSHRLWWAVPAGRPTFCAGFVVSVCGGAGPSVTSFIRLVLSLCDSADLPQTDHGPFEPVLAKSLSCQLFPASPETVAELAPLEAVPSVEVPETLLLPCAARRLGRLWLGLSMAHLILRTFGGCAVLDTFGSQRLLGPCG